MSKPKGKIASKPKRVVFNPHSTVVKDPVTGESRVGKYAHYCYEWDEMLIDENDPEFDACICGTPNPKT